jgi:GT2 family glycosyltransferase
MAKNKKIQISILNQGGINTKLVSQIQEIANTNMYPISIGYPAGKPITHNRNKIVKEFLESDFDFLLMMDGDCPPDDVEKMIEMADYDKDIIGGLCFGYLKEMIIPFAMKKNEQGTYDMADLGIRSGIQECDAIGSGNMMIARRVLENMPFAFKNEYDTEGIKIKGLDFNFCERAKEMGYKVWANTDLLCSHYTTVDLKNIWLTINEYRGEIRRQEEVIKGLKEENEGLKKTIRNLIEK